MRRHKSSMLEEHAEEEDEEKIHTLKETDCSL